MASNWQIMILLENKDHQSELSLILTITDNLKKSLKWSRHHTGEGVYSLGSTSAKVYTN